MEGGPPMFRQDFTCPALLMSHDPRHLYGAVTLVADRSRSFELEDHRHGPGPRSLATTSGVSVDVLSSGYLDVSVPRVRLSFEIPLRVGFPIRKSTDQSLFAAPHGLSQRTTSFIASQRQGIHRIPLWHLIALIIDAHPPSRTCENTDGQLSNFLERPHTFSSFARLNRRLTTTNPPGDLSPSDRTNLLFTMSKQHVVPLPKKMADETVVFGRVVTRALRQMTGGARRDRTDDLMLAKHALSQLSYGPTKGCSRDQWWARKDLNFRPHAYQARALTS